jgi:hypothetical protein
MCTPEYRGGAKCGDHRRHLHRKAGQGPLGAANPTNENEHFRHTFRGTFALTISGNGRTDGILAGGCRA